MKKIIIKISIGIAILVAVVFYLRYAENESYKKRGRRLIEKVEDYKNQHGMLPESVTLLDVESEMGEGPYYEKLDSTKYIIYFNIGFDNTLIFYSHIGEWEEKP